jgi:hypothetical protein
LAGGGGFVKRGDAGSCLLARGGRGRAAGMAGNSEMSREERLAAKLRENLRRRKAQARALGADEAAPGSTDSPPPLSKLPPSG